MMILWLVLLLAAGTAFVTLMVRLLRRGKRNAVLLIFSLLLVAGMCMHVVLLSRSSHTVTDGNWIQLFLISALASLEMFIGHTVVFDDIIAAVIFREPLLLLSYVTIFVLYILFTISLFFLIVPRGLKDILRLKIRRIGNKADKRRMHIFLGDTPRARLLARNIREVSPGDDLLFIHFPDPEENAGGELSIGEVLHTMFSRKKERTLADMLGYDHFMFIRGQLPSPACEDSLPKAVGLPVLEEFIGSKNTHVYILFEDDDYNFRFLKLLSAQKSIRAKVFCYNNNINNYTALYTHVHPRIRLLNRQEMFFTQVKRQEWDLMPVNVAPIARDSEGRSLAYATEGFAAMIIGFDATGQEALRFIHEFGSFVGKDLQPLQNCYHVVDPKVESLKGEFLSRTPAFRYDSDITWSAYSTGSERFWLDYAMFLPRLNYIVITVDSGHRNVEIAVRLLQEAMRCGKDLSRLKILVKATVEDSQLPTIIDFYNRNYCPEGISVIHPFGIPEKVWNLDVVTGKGLKAQALRYREVSAQISGDVSESWESRGRRIRERGGNALANYRELMRQQSVDIDTCLYAKTLYALAGERIPEENEEMISVLAASMQQYRVNALAVQGYVLGPEEDELNRRLPWMISYTDLSPQEKKKADVSALVSLEFASREKNVG